ncbi:hypothetical protein DAI22_12g118600 [Oryza sativa Japonica Group]|uniref:Uncharacterized protein n=1 Tax=Oryza sativa subsp. japonica TaxID=39947 RepID=Q2QRU7_ORYSJ|nr:hypothetical protein LOC_Os12g26350 [Oryza sativa Japonica Group]KAF2907708.1 hypothetical protein DAI22_12g118600 [Oryza sativa Japonica Group]
MAYHPPPSLTAAAHHCRRQTPAGAPLQPPGRTGRHRRAVLSADLWAIWDGIRLQSADSMGQKRIDLPCGASRQIDLVEAVLLLQQGHLLAE